MRRFWFLTLLLPGCGAPEAPPPTDPVPQFEEKPPTAPVNVDPNASPPPKAS